MREGVGAVGEAPFKNRLTPPPPQLTIFLHALPPSLIADIFRRKKFERTIFDLNILYYPPTSRYCHHYENNIYNPYTTCSCFIIK